MKRLCNIRVAIFVLAAAFFSARGMAAQESSPATKSADPRPDTSVQAPCAPSAKASASNDDQHRFWDQTNDWLFAAVGAARTLDYFSTLNMRRRGRQEILLTNDAVDNHAAFIAIEAAGTGTSIAASYLFHRYGHHKLERWVSMVHIGLATTGSVRNYCLKTFHSVPAASNP